LVPNSRDICKQLYEQIDTLEDAMRLYKKASRLYLNTEPDEGKRFHVSHDVDYTLKAARRTVTDAKRRAGAAEENMRKQGS
jgi:hypothetical protein